VVGGTVKEDKVIVNIEDAKGGNPKVLEAEYVLIATGRRALTKGIQFLIFIIIKKKNYYIGIGLEELGVEMDKLGRCVINQKM